MADSTSTDFLDMYVQAVERRLGGLLGQEATAAAMERVREAAAARLAASDFTMTIANSYKDRAVSAPASEVAAWMLAGRKPFVPILTGQGTLFRPHEEFHSVLGDMTRWLLSSRKVVRKRMDELQRQEGIDPDYLKAQLKVLDLDQKIWKLLANSLFGAFGEKSFHFYDVSMARAVTYTGQNIIAATIFGFESMIGGNAFIQSRDELWNHITACLKEVEGKRLEDWRPCIPDVAMARESLMHACAPGWAREAAIDEALATLGEELIPAIQYRGRMWDFLRDNDLATSLFWRAVAVPIPEADMGVVRRGSEDAASAVEGLWGGLRDWAAFPWFPADLPKRVSEMKRSVVLLSDTDSTFLYLNPWMDFVMTDLVDPDQITPEERTTVLNLGVCLLRLASDDHMWRLTTAMNVPLVERPRVNFKSEFVYKRVMITRGKKHYAGMITHQDGHQVKGGGRLDVKGLAIKKTSFSRVAGEYLENAMKTHVLDGETVDRVGFLRAIIELEQRVRDSLLSGAMIFSTPGVINRVSGYTRPWSMGVVRGMSAWNAACPDDPIREGDKVNMLPLRINSDITAFEALMAAMRESGDEVGLAALTAIGALFFWDPNEENLLTGNLNWLAVPKTVKTLPPWAVSLVDIDQLVSTNLAAALPILEAIDVVTLRLPSPETYSTTTHF